MTRISAILVCLIVAASPVRAEPTADCEKSQDLDSQLTACSALIAENRQNADAYLHRGMAYQHKNQFDQALQDYDKAIEIDPRSTLAYVNRGNIRVSEEHSDEAIADYTKAIEIDPKLAVAYIRRGDARLQAAGPDARRSFTGQGTIRAALQDYQKAIELNSNDPAAQEGHGDANVAMGDSRSVDAAIVDYSYAIAAEPTAPRYAKRAKAYAYFGAPLVDKALADYSSALALDDKWAGGYLARARLYMQKTDPGRALADYTTSIDIEPTAIAYRERAALFEKIKHDHEAALSDLNKALALDANDQDAKTAVASIEKQKFAEACMKAPSLQARWDACTDFLIRDRNSFAGHYQRGLVAAAMGNAAGAVIDFGLAATIDPKNWQAWFNLGTAYANEQKFDLAVEDFTQVTKLNPQFAPAYYARGLALSKLKKPDQAIADHSKAIELNPKLVGPYVSRASLYEAKGDLDRAIDDYDEIIKLIPNVPDAFEARGKLYRAKGDRKRAEADFNIADALRRHDNARP